MPASPSTEENGHLTVFLEALGEDAHMKLEYGKAHRMDCRCDELKMMSTKE